MNALTKSNSTDPDFFAIKSLFESGNIKSMKLLEKQGPTKMAKALGLQYNSYLDKLGNPQKFTFAPIFKIVDLCDLDPDLIYKVIKNQTFKNP
ncbi:hypothetical protein ACR784_08055 [Sphingobacterium multivorum]|jgi:hypothetical protein|uniref:hypothetical protein n=1 Tax=Sphingobacterium TaxID=28453 RepID=UPI000E95EE05|nr:MULTISPECIES: hypothetical protein [Sphingobacterium]MDF2849871.1 hypothetical protein [Sphingobacterium multivorum]HBI86782.1 hypothetical protein [Sphingobacterium sp.]